MLKQVIRRIIAVDCVLSVFFSLSANIVASADGDITSAVEQYDSKVWKRKAENYYQTSTSYGGLRVWYRIYKLSDEFNVSESYNYYLVDQTSYQSLDSEHNHVIYKKLFNNIKFMWLNIGVDFEAQVNELVPTQRLMEYNPKVMLTDYTYSTTVGGSFGTSINSKNEVGVTGNATYSRTVSYSTNDRKLVDKSRMNEDYLGTSYSYNCFTVKDTDAWDYVWKYLVAGNPGLIWATMTGGTVKHKDNFETFLSEMVEYSTFIVRIPKNENYFKIELSCTSNQLYIDYDYKNSHNFESVKASKVISIYNK